MKNKEKYEEDNEMKECTFEPKINTNIPRR